MIQFQQIRLRPGQWQTEEECRQLLRQKLARLLRISPEEVRDMKILKRALDARKKPDLFMTFSVAASLPKKIERRLQKDEKGSFGRRLSCSVYEEKRYVFPKAGSETLQERPVVVGMGPAGLFCAYYLAKYGYRPIVLERGSCIETRTKQVETFWQTGRLDPNSNVQFGEGGAGTFSDGKLNTLVKDPHSRHREVLECLVKNGAKEEILYESKPHLGTDALSAIVVSMRKQMEAWGAEIYFESRVSGLQIVKDRLCGLIVNETRTIPVQAAVFAIGHSARDTLQMLCHNHVAMEAKPFAVGLRIEHNQTFINEQQYGAYCPYTLPSADYKVTAKVKDGRGVYSFCMCPGGYVVNASSEPGHLAINGMSYSGRNGKNANSAMIVTVTPEDCSLFLKEHGEENNCPKELVGMMFQRQLERKAFLEGQGHVPVQLLEDYRQNRLSTTYGSVLPEHKGAVAFGNLRDVLPETLNLALIEGLDACNQKIPGFAAADALLSGVESRTSSPVRIHRGEDLQSAISGLYPCGEGAGYAGGIVSAAMDGLRVAETIRMKYKGCEWND